MSVPRHNIAAQVSELGADSLLPPEPEIAVGQIWRPTKGSNQQVRHIVHTEFDAAMPYLIYHSIRQRRSVYLDTFRTWMRRSGAILVAKP